mmetsp:Transcript_18814/g.32115  ORF Transcript_18814/g.32115 Transcript_18814/m.32115 type:complete len:221 (-) Transcript_18814:393-1055(-)
MHLMGLNGKTTCAARGGQSVSLSQASNLHRPLTPRSGTATHLCHSTSVKATLDVLKTSKAKWAPTVDPAYVEGATYLQMMGLSNQAEVARVLDVAMNPNSLFMDMHSMRSRNSSARSLSVEKDMQPVVEFLLSKAVSKGDILKIISGHPPVLSYSVQRLETYFAFFERLGVKGVEMGPALTHRPNMLGLDVDVNLPKIVSYLESIETPPAQIVEYLVKTI